MSAAGVRRYWGNGRGNALLLLFNEL